ncbi:MAG: hypothetical protein Q9163_005093, partial [Psora crenata]
MILRSSLTSLNTANYCASGDLSLLKQQFDKALDFHARRIQQSKGIAEFEEAMNRAKRAAGGPVLKAGNRLAKVLEVEGHGYSTRSGNETMGFGLPGFLDEIKASWERAGRNIGFLPVWQYVKEWHDLSATDASMRRAKNAVTSVVGKEA